MRDLIRNIQQHEYMNARKPPELFLLPAYTVLPLIRSPLGYELTLPSTGIRPLLNIIVLPIVGWTLYMAFAARPLPPNINHAWLVGFAVFCFVAQCCVFTRRSWGARNGAEIHSREAGYSFLVYWTPLPVWLCERLLVPGGFVIAGCYVMAHSLNLGWWLIVCGVSLSAMARWESRIRLAGTMGPVDAIIRAQVMEQRLERHERQAQRKTKQPAVAEGLGEVIDFAELGSGRKGR